MKTLRNFKYFIYRFLIWCSGSNPDILENKARFSDKFVCGRSEQIKHAWTGALVLIPPLLAFCGMLYAASTLDISKEMVLFIACIWGIIIFILERYIVTSFRKSNSVKKDLLSVTFMIRMIFSIGVGFTIADPLIHGIFKESIDKKLIEMNQSEIDLISQEAYVLTEQQELKKEKLDIELKEKDELIAQFDKMLSDEIDGLVGRSSGISGDGPSAKEKRRIRNRMLFERGELVANIDIEKARIDSVITQIEINRNQQIQNRKFSHDYLAQRHALSVLANENADIWWVRLFLTVFLIFIDVCCILYKAASSKGPYDDHINYEEYLSEIESKMEENKINTEYKARREFNEEAGKEIVLKTSELSQKLQANSEAVLAIYEDEKKFNQKMIEEHIQFREFVKERRKEIEQIDDEIIKDEENKILNRMIKEFYDKANQAIDEHSYN